MFGIDRKLVVIESENGYQVWVFNLKSVATDLKSAMMGVNLGWDLAEPRSGSNENRLGPIKNWSRPHEIGPRYRGEGHLRLTRSRDHPAQSCSGVPPVAASIRGVGEAERDGPAQVEIKILCSGVGTRVFAGKRNCVTELGVRTQVTKNK